MKGLAVSFGLLHLLLTAPSTLQLSSTVPEGTILHACAGEDLALTWNVTYAVGEKIHEVHWYYEAAGQTQEMIAMLSNGHFLTMPAYSHRLQHIPDAGLLLNHVTVSDTGNYSVQVSVHNATNDILSLHRTAILEMSEEPVTVSGQLVVSQQEDLTYDADSQEWHVVLLCGKFAFVGNPPTDVEWTTPDGATLSSNSFDSGYFKLHLPNPVKGGNYTCRIRADTPAASCLPSNNTLLQEAAVMVDGWKARLMVVEATQMSLRRENHQLKEDLEHQQNVTDEHFSALEVENAHLRDDNSRLTELVHSLENHTMLLQYQLDGLQINTSQPQVSFHARLTQDVQVNRHDVIVLPTVTTNIGEAYNSTAGVFTAPLPGSYFFEVSTASYKSNGTAMLEMMVTESGGFVCSVLTDSGVYQTGSCQAAVHLDQGDVVWLRSSGEGYFAGVYTAFTGFLIAAD